VVKLIFACVVCDEFAAKQHKKVEVNNTSARSCATRSGQSNLCERVQFFVSQQNANGTALLAVTVDGGSAGDWLERDSQA
jgi:hypothetical protein